MALSATTVWEVRATATAGALNGGGFNSAASGTDYSQQDAAQYTFANLASTSASGFLVVTSASHNFVAADVGNIIHITTTGTGAHFTTGWYEIISCVGNAATLDRACGSVADASGGTFYVGGALNWDATTTATALNTAQPGNIVWIKAGTYTQASTISITSVGTGLLPNFIIGYNTTRGDNPTGTNRPLINQTANSASTQISLPNTGFWNVSNLAITTTSAAGLLANGPGVCQNVQIINSSTTAARAAFSVGNATYFNCEAVSYRGIGFTAGNNNHAIIGCYIHDCDTGILNSGTSTGFFWANNIIANCVTKAISLTGARTAPGVLLNSTLYGSENKLGIGVSAVASSFNGLFMNNIVYGFVTGFSFADATNLNNSLYNSVNNCTTARTNFPVGIGDVTTAPGFTSVAQVTGTAATTSGSVLTDGAANFSNVTDNQDYVYIASGTGVTAGIYKITAHTTTTITLDIAPGTSAVSDKAYQVTTGRNLSIGANLQALSMPGLPGAQCTTYLDIGAVQRQVDVPAVANVRSGTAYDAGLKTGTAAIPTAANVRSGTATDATTGTLAVPSAANVRSGISVDAGTGTLVVPSLSNTKTGVAGDGGTGTYDGSDRWDAILENNVRYGAAYKQNSTSNNKTGTLQGSVLVT